MINTLYPIFANTDPEWVTPGRVESIFRVVFLLFVVLPLLWMGARYAGRFMEKRYTAHLGQMVRKAITYGGSVLIFIMVLTDLGFKLTPLLGAAGIMGIAIGFAAQTTLSNFISGLFLITEKPFAIGDVITVGDTTGIVLSIDLMSVKVRLFDNRFVRIPSSLLIQREFINNTRFPIRRLDINVSVAYKEDVAVVRDVLKDVADRNPHCLDEPAPLIIFMKYGDSGLEFLFAVWALRTDFLALRNSIMQEVKDAFDQKGIEIPFPHRTLYTGAATEPFPIRLVSGEKEPVPVEAKTVGAEPEEEPDEEAEPRG
ncbi:MAG: mechanosensitive ion channel family protein [Opitutales bacterium]|nr:mechanosensitive ion channel family protein [Opitutales bacterium]